MRGRRCRALRREFKARYGRPVGESAIVRRGPGWYEASKSEWRQLKRGGAARFEASVATERVLARATAADARRYRKGEARRRRRADRVVAAA